MDCQLVLILNYQKLFAIFESFALSAVSGCAVWGQRCSREGQWQRLVLQAARIPLAQIPWVLVPHTLSCTLTSLLRLAVARKYATF